MNTTLKYYDKIYFKIIFYYEFKILKIKLACILFYLAVANIGGFWEVRRHDFMLATFLEGAFELSYLRALAKYMNYSYFVIRLKFLCSLNVRMNSINKSFFLHITHCFL